MKQALSESWREELKGTLLHDLFLARQGQTVMVDNLQKVFRFTLRNLEGRTLDVSGELETIYSQQPQLINYLESYYTWIHKVTQGSKFLAFKNGQYREAIEHFSSQIRAFNVNLNQAKDNEIFLE